MEIMEIDEICRRKSPSQWLWIHASMNGIAVSRLVGHVLGFALGNRSVEMLEWFWEDIPEDYCDVPICTDRLATYQQFFEGTDHEVCDKGRGKTSIVEGMNTKWRQRQSGLVRRSYGVWQGIEDGILSGS